MSNSLSKEALAKLITDNAKAIIKENKIKSDGDRVLNGKNLAKHIYSKSTLKNKRDYPS